MMKCARDLRLGDTVLAEDEPATIESTRWCNGRDGSTPVFISGGGSKTAIAIAIQADGKNYFLHPAQMVEIIRTDVAAF